MKCFFVRELLHWHKSLQKVGLEEVSRGAREADLAEVVTACTNISACELQAAGALMGTVVHHPKPGIGFQ